MNLTVTGKNIQVTEGLRSYVEKKMERVKFYFPHLIDVHVVMEVEKKINHKVEITIQGEGKVFHSEFKAEDMYESIDGLIDRVERQVKRYKDKLHDFSAKRVAPELEDHSERPDFVFTKVREIFPKPMSEEEAVLQLKNSDYKFHIYKKSPEMTEEDFKKLADNNVSYQKSVIIKEGANEFIVITKTKNDWEEHLLKMEGNQLKKTNAKVDIKVEEKTVEEAVNGLLKEKKNYFLFYDKDHKNLSIVYKRKNNTLGLIVGNNNAVN